MPRLLTNREMELFRKAIQLKKSLDDTCPNVGMGPSTITLAREVADELSFDIDEDDLAEMCESAGIF